MSTERNVEFIECTKSEYENLSDKKDNALYFTDDGDLYKGTTAYSKNVQSDWNATSGDAFIKNKPTVPTKVSDLTNDSGYTTNTGTITGINMNGASKGTSGVVDLGTVLTGGSQTTTSSVDSGSNVYTFSDGSTITVKNGSKGDTGATGPQGPKGDTGATGLQGPKGDTGATGLQGPKGDKGDTGATGPQGPAGATPTIKVAAGSNIETTGTPSVTASTSGTTTTFTFNYLKGATGLQGPKGDKGDTGPQGPQGLKGDTGLQGPKGDKGDTGPKGDKGATGATGPKGDTGATGLQGPKGDKGDTGLQGPKGDTGANGVSCTHSWNGTTLTVTSASGSSSANLKGPKGDKGDTGPQGPKGDKGTNATTTAVVSTSANGLAPKVTDTSKFLRGDGTWATPTDTITGGTIAMSKTGLPTLNGSVVGASNVAIGKNGIGIGGIDTSNDGAAIFMENGGTETNRLIIGLGDDATQNGTQDYIAFRYYDTAGNVTYESKVPSKSGTIALTSDIPTIPSSLPANGGNASTVNGHTVNADVPSGAKFTDTVYTHPTTSGNKHIPSGGSSGQILKWSADGTATWGNEESVPLATASANGLMSSTQFKNLKDLISTNVSAMGTSMPGAFGRILKLSSPINGPGNDAYAIGIDTTGRLYTYFGNNGSTTAKWKTLLLQSDIYIESLSLGSMTLQGNWDGDAPQVMPAGTSAFYPFCIIPRSAGSADVCWIDCYMVNGSTKVRLKNTVSGTKTFTPSVYVIYMRVSS